MTLGTLRLLYKSVVSNMNVYRLASALEPVQDMIAYLWHSDAPDEFEKMIDILSLLIPMFPLLFISYCHWAL